MRQAFERDRGCVFSEGVQNVDSVVATWIFPPFLGYEASMHLSDDIPQILTSFLNQLSKDPYLENKYYDDPDSCDLSELMVVPNIISGRKDIVALFWENKLGVDVDACLVPRHSKIHTDGI